MLQIVERDVKEKLINSFQNSESYAKNMFDPPKFINRRRPPFDMFYVQLPIKETNRTDGTLRIAEQKHNFIQTI